MKSAGEASVAPGWERRRTALFGEYERVALALFASKGFRHVKVEEVAEAIGVSTRTLFRYFPTKDDYLLAFPRRWLESNQAMIATLPADPSPLRAAWNALRTQFDEGGIDLELAMLWRTAAFEVPEVIARTRGERYKGLVEAVSEYCARSLGVAETRDARPGVYAGIIAGAELAILDSWGRTSLSRAELVEAADACFRSMTAGR